MQNDESNLNIQKISLTFYFESGDLASIQVSGSNYHFTTACHFYYRWECQNKMKNFSGVRVGRKKDTLGCSKERAIS